MNQWDANAQTWDESMEDGSAFQKTLVEPHTLKFLGSLKNKKVLDLACGNGQMSRHMAQLGAQVTAIDGSKEMIRLAQQRTKDLPIEYHVMDLTQEESLKSSNFDAVLCNMSLMDIPDLKPIFRLAYKALHERGVFVFSITHPCFDKSVGPHLTEIHENDGIRVSEHSIKVSTYLTPSVRPVKALPTFPETHSFYHRPLHSYLNAAFEEGFVMCDISEPSFPKETNLTTPSGWQKLPEIPVVLIVKLRK